MPEIWPIKAMGRILWLYFTKPAYMESINYMAMDALTMLPGILWNITGTAYMRVKSPYNTRVPKSSALSPLPPV